MNPNKALLITLLLAISAFAFGYRSYTQAEQRIAADLSQALQQTVIAQRHLWLNTDSIRAYTHLQKLMGTPVTVSSANHLFAAALTLAPLKDVSHLSLHIHRKDEPQTVARETPSGYIAGDTLLYLNADSEGVTLAFRGYARCSAGLILRLADLTIPAVLMLCTVAWGVFAFFRCRRTSSVRRNTSAMTDEDECITFGNLTLSTREACFYDERREKLRLTPMQYALMEMFYLSPTRRLSKPDICQALWPDKENADETLYTLIRRLKPVVESHSNLHITTDRGRSYGLELGTM